MHQADSLDLPVTQREFNHHIDRLDTRMEVLIGASEDRLTGKMAEMEARMIRRMDAGFEQFALIIARSYNELCQRMDERFAQMDQRFAQMDKRFDQVDARMGRLEGRMDGIEGRMDGIEGRMYHLEGQIDGLDQRMESLESRP